MPSLRTYILHRKALIESAVSFLCIIRDLRTSGGFAGGVVQSSTKSGSTEFHGSAYEYSLRGEAGQKTGDDYLTRTDISS
jgi:hypothetical protein